MKKLNEKEMRTLDGGKRRYTKCNKCGATYQANWGYLMLNLHRIITGHYGRTIVFYR